VGERVRPGGDVRYREVDHQCKSNNFITYV